MRLGPQPIIRNPRFFLCLFILYFVPGPFAQLRTPHTITGRVAQPDSSPAAHAIVIQDLERATDAEPGNATNCYYIGVDSVALDRREQARAALQEALSIDPVASVRAHVHHASLLIKENHPPEAAKEIEAYLQAVPDPFDAEKLRALLSQLRAAAKS
jgi:cytochrome c-type biogenesis protein CcmH/NrfG